MILYRKPLQYWSYYCSLERDLINYSQYVEYAAPNFGTYSIESSKMILSTGSEVDVVLKHLCKEISGKEPHDFKQYRAPIRQKYPEMIKEEVTIKRCGLKFQPFVEWIENKPLGWWIDYNLVKHHRTEEFAKANLQNLLLAFAALHVAVHYYYLAFFQKKSTRVLKINHVVEVLDPKPDLMKFTNFTYYYKIVS